MDWHNAINGVTEKPQPTQEEFVAHMNNFAAAHNARLKQGNGGMGSPRN